MLISIAKNILYHSVHLLRRSFWAQLLSEDTHAFNPLGDFCFSFKCGRGSYTRSHFFFHFLFTQVKEYRKTEFYTMSALSVYTVVDRTE